MNIVDRLEEWIRGGMISTPEREAWGRSIMESAAQHALNNWVPGAPREDRPKVTLSSHFYCPRELHYALIGADKEDPAPRAFDAFAIGVMVEAMAVAKCVLAGLDVVYPTPDGKQFRDTIMLGGDPIRGSVDMVIRDADGTLIPIEVKSMADYGHDVAKRSGVENTFGYVDQLQHYIAMMKAPYGVFLAVRKSTGHTIQQIVKADSAVIAASEKAYIAAKAGLPPRPDWAVTKTVASPGGKVERIDSVRCGYCSRRAVCWEGFEQAVVSGKPVWQRRVEA